MSSSGIYRVKKDARYFQASNEPFNDSELSWEARGVMGYLLSKPDGWEVREDDLLQQGPAGKHKIARIMQELKARGYLHRHRVRQEDGTFRWETEVYESASLNPHPRPTTTRKSGNGSSTTRLSRSGSSSSGSSTPGKPGHIVKTEVVKTEVVRTEKEKTETAADIEPAAETAPNGTAAVSGSSSTTDSNDILAALQVLNGRVAENPEWGEPISAPEELSEALRRRGETVDSMRLAWAGCKRNARKPVAAFLSWCRKGTPPPRAAATEPSAPVERVLPDGTVERWMGDGTGWGRVGRIAQEVG